MRKGVTPITIRSMRLMKPGFFVFCRIEGRVIQNVKNGPDILSIKTNKKSWQDCLDVVNYNQNKEGWVQCTGKDPQQLKPDAGSEYSVSVQAYRPWEGARREQQASGFCKVSISEAWPEAAGSQRAQGGVSSGQDERNPTKGLTYEELGRNNGNMISVVEELEIVSRMGSWAYPIEMEVAIWC